MQFMVNSYKSENTVRGKCALTLYQASLCAAVFFYPSMAFSAP